MTRTPLDMGGAFAGVPLCTPSCPQHDGKRCKSTGNEPSEVCVPEVRAIAAERDVLREQADAANRIVADDWHEIKRLRVLLGLNPDGTERAP